MQDKLNESLGDLEEGLPEPSCACYSTRHQSFGLYTSYIHGEEAKPIRQPQRRLNPHLQEVVRAEVLKLLQAGEEIATRLTSGWRVCIDYRKLNVDKEDHFPLPFIDQVLERVSGHPFYCFLDGYSGYFQIEIDVEDQEKTTFTCPFGTYAYRRMPFGLCNAPATFQRCMLSIFSDMVERIMEVFMDDITIYGGTFEECLVNLEAVLNRCIEKDLVLNWEKCHFMVQQGIVLGHIISKETLKLIKQRRFIKISLSFQSLFVNYWLRMLRVVLGQREYGKPYVIYYASKTLNEAQRNYITTEKELCKSKVELDGFSYYKSSISKSEIRKKWRNVVADHLSRKHSLYAHIANYLVTGEVPNQIIRKCVPEEEQQGILSHCHESACGGHFASQKTAMKVLQSGFSWPSPFKNAQPCVEAVINAKGSGN
ncbi:Retrovirus-related Pol polyprotein from transposon 297 [Vitis vinifera]|uniref:Retrovirus-related Pol polyprotein from transposon 297 n=1 Tax=Vitis vinifera TaxID=29760 RepID=A0A438CDG2_VITVI|nr:Retrovirus-related Pol polyprotein from transposon 297 [Vitis vinifera]